MLTTLSQLIAFAESSNNPNAVRFEPAFEPSLLAIAKCAKANNCNLATAKIICAMSFGKYQIMGEELYRRGIWTLPIAAYANDPAAQDSAFVTFTKQKGIYYSLAEILTDATKRDNFAHLYNGNAAAYGPYLLAVYKEHQ